MIRVRVGAGLSVHVKKVKGKILFAAFAHNPLYLRPLVDTFWKRLLKSFFLNCFLSLTISFTLVIRYSAVFNRNYRLLITSFIMLIATTSVIGPFFR